MLCYWVEARGGRAGGLVTDRFDNVIQTGRVWGEWKGRRLSELLDSLRITRALRVLRLGPPVCLECGDEPVARTHCHCRSAEPARLQDATVVIPARFVVQNRVAVKDEVLRYLLPGAAVTLDFSHNEYADSSALGVLVNLQRRARQAGATLLLRQVSPELRQVFDLTRLSYGFEWADGPHAGRAPVPL